MRVRGDAAECRVVVGLISKEFARSRFPGSNRRRRVDSSRRDAMSLYLTAPRPRFFRSRGSRYKESTYLRSRPSSSVTFSLTNQTPAPRSFGSAPRSSATAPRSFGSAPRTLTLSTSPLDSALPRIAPHRAQGTQADAGRGCVHSTPSITSAIVGSGAESTSSYVAGFAARSAIGSALARDRIARLPRRAPRGGQRAIAMLTAAGGCVRGEPLVRYVKPTQGKPTMRPSTSVPKGRTNARSKPKCSPESRTP